MTSAPVSSSFAQMDTSTNATEKELYLPAKVWRVPGGSDYNDTASVYSYKRMVQSAT
jgi:hypothetical protein